MLQFLAYFRQLVKSNRFDRPERPKFDCDGPLSFPWSSISGLSGVSEGRELIEILQLSKVGLAYYVHSSMNARAARNYLSML
jgi:hypothetical protein